MTKKKINLEKLDVEDKIDEIEEKIEGIEVKREGIEVKIDDIGEKRNIKSIIKIIKKNA